MRAGLVRCTVASSVILSLMLLGSRAHADQSTGFSLNGYDPSERGSDWFSNESLDLRGNFRPAFGVTGDLAYRPLVVYDSNNNYQSSVVNDQFTLHVGGSLVMWDRLRIGANLPLVLQQSGDGGTIDTVAFAAPSSSAAVGDLRVGADVRLFGEYGDVATVAVGARAYIPTGQRDDYTGDGEFRLEPRAMIAGDVGVFTYAARVGVMIRGFDNDLGSPLGTQLTFGGSVGARLVDKKLTVGPEVWGGGKLGQNDPAFTATTTPLEGVIGAHYVIADMLRRRRRHGPDARVRLPRVPRPADGRVGARVQGARSRQRRHPRLAGRMSRHPGRPHRGPEDERLSAAAASSPAASSFRS